MTEIWTKNKDERMKRYKTEEILYEKPRNENIEN